MNYSTNTQTYSVIHSISVVKIHRTNFYSMDIRATRRLNGQPSRARIACLHCRSRKVRCTLAIKGPPCTNCQLDGLECVTRPKLRKRSRASIHTSLAEEAMPSTQKQEIETHRYDVWKTGEIQDNAQRICDLNGMNIFGHQTPASGSDEVRLIEAALSVDSCMIPKNPSIVIHRLGPTWNYSGPNADNLH